MMRIDPELFDLILDNLPIGVGVFDLEGTIRRANATLLGWLDIGAEDLADAARGRRLPEHIGALFTEAENIIVPPSGNRPARSLVAQHLRLGPGRNGIARVSFYRDVSQLPEIEPVLQALQEKTEQLALSDPVTGLPNRRALVRALEPMVSRSRRYSNPLSVVIMRVDNVRAVEATQGAAAADQVLIAIGHLLRDQTRWADMLGRVDTRSFALLLQETTRADAVKLVSKIAAQTAKLAAPATTGHGQPVQTSFGVAEWRMGDDVNSLLERAQAACAANA